MNNLGLEMDLAALALQRAGLSRLWADLAAAAGAALRRFDQPRLLAEKLRNHLARDLIEVDDRRSLDLVETGRLQLGECSGLRQSFDDQVRDPFKQNRLTRRFHGNSP
jgi:hypothetical protein